MCRATAPPTPRGGSPWSVPLPSEDPEVTAVGGQAPHTTTGKTAHSRTPPRHSCESVWVAPRGRSGKARAHGSYRLAT